jgi:bifunctional non-homologous end joining protein LigD
LARELPPFAAPETAPPQSAHYSVILRYSGGSSDKAYQLEIAAVEGGYSVLYANGRWGGSMNMGFKTKAPVTWPEARKICNSQLMEKLGKGYQPTTGTHLELGAAAAQRAAHDQTRSGQVPQLLNAIEAPQLESMLTDPNYFAQEKHDGERRLLFVENGEVRGGNRLGGFGLVPRPVVEDILKLGRTLTLDGELVGNRYHAFDLLALDGQDYRHAPAADRARLLATLDLGGAVMVSPTEFTTAGKNALHTYVMENNLEGMVFKHVDAPYAPGRPSNGGSWLKFKNWQSLSAAVGAINEQRSVGLSLLQDDGNWVGVGNVTVPANQPIPEIGDVVEIRYLYAFEGGSLFEPTLLGKRNDILLEECRASQRMFKPATLEDAAPGL